MKSIDIDHKQVRSPVKTVIALGNFDGVHLGHQALLQAAVRRAREAEQHSAVLLFKNHTASVLTDSSKQYLTSVEDKIRVLSNFGVDYAFLCTFSPSFAAMSKDDFLDEVLLNRLRACAVVVGQDYRYGSHASGSVRELQLAQQQGRLAVSVVPDVKWQEKRISSTLIRACIQEGKVEEANRMLGRPYQIQGKVVHGLRRGHTLGYPTANVEPSFPYVIPADGVYLTQNEVNGKNYYAMTSVGMNPTFEDIPKPTIESYLFDFSAEVYDTTMSLRFLRYERENIRFDSIEALIHQLQQDDILLREWSKNWN